MLSTHGTPFQSSEAACSPCWRRLIDAPFDNKDWVFETKWDGFRLVARIEKGRVTLYLAQWSDRQRQLHADRQGAGEGKARRRHRRRTGGARCAWGVPLSVVAECASHHRQPPLLRLRHHVPRRRGLAQLPLTERKKRLKPILPKNPLLTYSEHWPEHGKRLFKEAEKLGPRRHHGQARRRAGTSPARAARIGSRSRPASARRW